MTSGGGDIPTPTLCPWLRTRSRSVIRRRNLVKSPSLVKARIAWLAGAGLAYAAVGGLTAIKAAVKMTDSDFI